MTTFIRNYIPGDSIPDVESGVFYEFSELDGAVLLWSDPLTGDEAYELQDGRTALLQSIDLDWTGDDSAILRTTSAPELYPVDETPEPAPVPVVPDIERKDPHPGDIGGWVLWHNRTPDTVLFGPFPTLEDAGKWWDTEGKKRGVAWCPAPLVSPECPHSRCWNPAPWLVFGEPKKNLWLATSIN